MDLWPEFKTENTSEESMAVEILEEQAQLLSEKTGGKVRAKFYKVQYTPSLQTFAETVSRVIGSQKVTEATDEDLVDKKDINLLYDYSKFYFELFNETYHFRVFTLKNRTIFPIQMVMDEGIWEELNFPLQEQPLEINGNEDLKDVVKQVFSSKKVISIVNRLMKASCPE